jgi:hypothetical protein
VRCQWWQQETLLQSCNFNCSISISGGCGRAHVCKVVTAAGGEAAAELQQQLQHQKQHQKQQGGNTCIHEAATASSGKLYLQQWEHQLLGW